MPTPGLLPAGPHGLLLARRRTGGGRNGTVEAARTREPVWAVGPAA